MKPSKTAGRFDYVFDGFYLTQSAKAGKCLGCGELIPQGWKDWPDNHQWLRLHWRGRISAAGAESPLGFTKVNRDSPSTHDAANPPEGYPVQRTIE